jgi:hypothetical protein
MTIAEQFGPADTRTHRTSRAADHRAGKHRGRGGGPGWHGSEWMTRTAQMRKGTKMVWGINA